MKEYTAPIPFRGLLAFSSYKSCNAEGYADILQENWFCDNRSDDSLAISNSIENNGI